MKLEKGMSYRDMKKADDKIKGVHQAAGNAPGTSKAGAFVRSKREENSPHAAEDKQRARSAHSEVLFEQRQMPKPKLEKGMAYRDLKKVEKSSLKFPGPKHPDTSPEAQESFHNLLHTKFNKNKHSFRCGNCNVPAPKGEKKTWAKVGRQEMAVCQSCVAKKKSKVNKERTS
jgi:hypothetical protein